MTSLASIRRDIASDVTYAVLCGQCPDLLGEHAAYYAVAYDTVIDGEPTGERLFTCRDGLGETYAWAEAHHQSFVPIVISRLGAPVPACPYCSAELYDCVTDSYGLCVKAGVA